jgi:undecaprenyl diphosphate synthase
MDGNGRWAKKKGALRVFGHQSAVQAVRDTVEGAAEIGIPYLTLYAFSTENWNRPKREVNALMELLVSTIRKETPTLLKNRIRLHAIGRTQDLPPKCQVQLQETIEATQANQHLTLTLALSYGSRSDQTEAIRRLLTQAWNHELHPDQLTEALIREQLSTAALPDPELLIRTSGEQRISNFLLWELAYTELYFTPKLWPDFRRTDLFEALRDYQSRERRFGKTGDQIQAEGLTTTTG